MTMRFIVGDTGGSNVARMLFAAALLALAVAPNGRVLAQDQAASGRAGSPPRRRAANQPKPRLVVDRLQARIDEVLRQRLQLTDDQFGKLRALNARLDAERKSVRQEEAQTRKALRNELLDQLPVVERKRIALQEREQKEMAGFMQPAQRARYFALQDEIRRGLQDAQRRRVAGDSAYVRPSSGSETSPHPGGRFRPSRSLPMP
jgi:parvulin-like peptidyl-prolyl isomerase